MEKFGIFELLDALSAAMEGAENMPPKEQSPKTDDRVFAPPDYFEGKESVALSSLLDRHEKIRKRVDEQTKKEP